MFEINEEIISRARIQPLLFYAIEQSMRLCISRKIRNDVHGESRRADHSEHLGWGTRSNIEVFDESNERIEELRERLRLDLIGLDSTKEILTPKSSILLPNQLTVQFRRDIQEYISGMVTDESVVTDRLTRQVCQQAVAAVLHIDGVDIEDLMQSVRLTAHESELFKRLTETLPATAP